MINQRGQIAPNGNAATLTGSVRGWWAGALVAAGLLYGLTTAPGVLWGDSGEAQLRVLLGAWEDAREVVRAHIPYYVTASAIRGLLHCDAAWAANLTAALAGAVTIANFAGLLRLLVASHVARIAGIALLLLSHTLWQMSTGAEVITFATMCLSFELLMVVCWLQDRRTKWLALAALANGLGWSTHNLALLTLPAYAILLLTYRPLAKDVGRRAWFLVTGAWLLGAAPIITLGIKEYFKLESAGQALRSVMVGIYAPEVFNHEIGATLLTRVAGYFVLNFPTPLLFVAPLGWWLLRRRAVPGIWLFLTAAGLAHCIFAARYAVPDQYTFFVPTFLFVVLFITVGVDGGLQRWTGQAAKVAVVGAAVLAPMIYAAAPTLSRRYAGDQLPLPSREIPHRDRYEWFLTPWRTGYDGAERFAREVFAALPPDAVLWSDSTLRRPMQYLQCQAGLRSDVVIVDAFLRTGPHSLGSITVEEATALSAGGRLYSTSCARGYAPTWMTGGGFICEPQGEPPGVVLRVDRAPPSQ